MGLSLEALHAGYALDINVTMMDVVVAMLMYMGLMMGVNESVGLGV